MSLAEKQHIVFTKNENSKILGMASPGVENVATPCESIFTLPRGSQRPYGTQIHSLYYHFFFYIIMFCPIFPILGVGALGAALLNLCVFIAMTLYSAYLHHPEKKRFPQSSNYKNDYDCLVGSESNIHTIRLQNQAHHVESINTCVISP